MEKGQAEDRCLEENPQPQVRRDRDSPQQQSPRGGHSSEEEETETDWEGECAMKRSQGFSSPFGFGEEHPARANDTATQDGRPPNDLSGVNTAELESAEEEDRAVRHPPPRHRGFRRQELWLAVTRWLSCQWPPCLSLHLPCERKIEYQADLDRSESTPSPDTSDATTVSSWSESTPPDNRDEAAGDGTGDAVVSGPARRPAAGPHSSLGVPRARLAGDLVLASGWLDRETVLRVELLEMGDESDHWRYRAEWTLSEKNKELAQGVWLSQSRKPWTD